MKIRFFSLLLATIMLTLTFTSCSKKAEPADTSTSTIETVSTNETESTTTTTTTTQSTTEKETTKPTTTKETSPIRKPTTPKKTNVSTTKGAKSITVSKSNIKLKVGESVKINITAKNSYEVIYYSTESKSVTCKWGTWKGDTTSLTITGRRGGTAKIVFYFESNPNKIMATVNVTVTEDSTTTAKPQTTKTPTTTAKPTNTTTKHIAKNIKVDRPSINLNVGEKCSVVVTCIREGSNYTVVGSNSNPNVIEYEWGDWNGDTIPLEIIALQSGSSTISLYYEDNPNKIYATVKVNVTADTSSDKRINEYAVAVIKEIQNNLINPRGIILNSVSYQKGCRCEDESNYCDSYLFYVDYSGTNKFGGYVRQYDGYGVHVYEDGGYTIVKNNHQITGGDIGAGGLENSLDIHKLETQLGLS